MKLKDADKIISQCEEYANLLKCDGSTEREWATVKRIMQIINEAPTIEPDTDTISRRATINAIQNHFNPTGAELSPDLAPVLAGVGVVINTMPPSPSRPQWIPCSERLPEEDNWLGGSGRQFSDDVLVSVVNYNDKEIWTHISQTIDGEWALELPSHCKIIAWMPMPEPYLKGDTI